MTPVSWTAGTVGWKRSAGSSGPTQTVSSWRCPPRAKEAMTTVLICDDHRQIREGLRASVQALPGVDRVDTAASGEEVLARWPSDRQDLGLMDLQMPGPVGLEPVARAVVAASPRRVRHHPDANVVMLTGAADPALVPLPISGGARGYLHKDVSREELC